MTERQPAAHFPWGIALIFVLAIGALWMLFRRRSGLLAISAGGAVAGGAPRHVWRSGRLWRAPATAARWAVEWGLASPGGLGLGACAWAPAWWPGEELAHHFLDGGRREGTIVPPAGLERLAAGVEYGHGTERISASMTRARGMTAVGVVAAAADGLVVERRGGETAMTKRIDVPAVPVVKAVALSQPLSRALCRTGPSALGRCGRDSRISV